MVDSIEEYNVFENDGKHIERGFYSFPSEWDVNICFSD